MTNTPVAVTAEAPPRSLLGRFFGIIISPQATFRSVVAHPRVFGMLALICVGMAVLVGGFLYTKTGQLAWLDARHRSHVHVEDDVKQAKAIGLNRWPSRHWKVNVAWITVVAMAASLLAAFRHLGLPDGDLRKASIKSLRFRLFEVPGRITYGQRKTWLHLPADWPWTPDLTASWQTIKTLPIPI